MHEIWRELSANQQDLLIFLSLVLPVVVVAFAVSFRFAPYAVVRSIFIKNFTVNIVFVAVIATSIAISVALIIQERAVREVTANAVNKFDLIVAPSGSEITQMLKVVFLQPLKTNLLDGNTLNEIKDHPNVTMAAPLAFGDNWNGYPIIGTTNEFLNHLYGTKDKIYFNGLWDGIAGVGVGLEAGRSIMPSHGLAGVQQRDNDLMAEHADDINITQVAPVTGTPWDGAILVTIESVWVVHGLPDGHVSNDIDKPNDMQLGHPFDPVSFPGTSAVIVKTKKLYDLYNVREDFNSDGLMAFFPGNILSRLHAVLGDVRALFSVLSTITQFLVSLSIILGISVFAKLLRHRFALLQALGAPRRFVLAVMWWYGATIIISGTILGTLVGFISTGIVSGYVSELVGLRVQGVILWEELHLIGGFLGITSLAILVPAIMESQRPIVAGLREN